MGKPGHLGGTLSQAGLDGQILILALSAVTDLMAEVVFSESHKHTRSVFFSLSTQRHVYIQRKTSPFLM